MSRRTSNAGGLAGYAKMGCDICIGGGDHDGYPEFFEEAWPKARKDHRCCECRKTIPKGEEYQACSGKFDGAFFYEKTCAACAEIRRTYSCGGDQPAFTGLWEAFEDSDGFNNFRMAGECWDSLTAPAKAKLLDKWRQWKGLTNG